MFLTLFGISLAPLYLSLVLYPKDAAKAISKMMKQPSLRFLTGWLLMFIAFILIAIGGPFFQFEWENLMSWLALLIAIKGVTYLLLPGLVVKMEKKFVKPEKCPIYGFLGLLFVLFLVYVDTQLIA